MRIPILLIVGIVYSVSCNVWDNMFSKADMPRLEIHNKFSSKYSLKQFSLLNLTLEIDYNGADNKVQIALSTNTGLK